MNGFWKILSKIGVGLLTLALLAAAPQAADAANVGFRNDTKSRILVQGQTVINGQVRKGPLLVIEPGKTACDLNVPPGLRQYTICDGFQTTRMLYRDSVQVGNQNLLYSVQPAPGNRVILHQLPPPPN